MQRYDYNCETARMTHSPDGDFVYYAAVVTLEAENAALREKLAAIEVTQGKCKGCDGHGMVGNILDVDFCPFCHGTGKESEQDARDVEITALREELAKAKRIDREAVREAVAEALAGTYWCGRVWSAWQLGTMSENDFHPAEEVEEVLDGVVDAAIDAAMKVAG